MNVTELLNWDEYVKILLGLLALTDPFSLAPLFLGATQGLSAHEREGAARTAITVFVVTMLIMIFLGGSILGLFGITLAAFRIAGGLLFMFYALHLLGLIQIPNAFAKIEGGGAKSIGVVPLGIPLLAGPGAISNIILNAAIHEGLEHKILVSVVVLVTAVIIYIIWRLAAKLGDRISPTSTIIANRILGLLLAAISIEFILDGIAAHFPTIITVH